MLRQLSKLGRSTSSNIDSEELVDGAFSAESLFDYINESAAALAKVLAVQMNAQDAEERRKSLKKSLPRSSLKKHQSKSRKMSVVTTVSNKAGK